LIQRREIDLRRELEQRSPRLQRLSLREGEMAADMAREASTIRYRELYGFTHADPKYVYHAELGRGVELFLMGVPAEKRLPLRAVHSAMIYKNGVPIGYFEGLSLFERMESGFNLYYTTSCATSRALQRSRSILIKSDMRMKKVSRRERSGFIANSGLGRRGAMCWRWCKRKNRSSTREVVIARLHGR
jgi:hypothetical protein